MIFVSPLTPAQQQALESLHQTGHTHRVRQRAQAVLLSASGYPLPQLAALLRSDRDTIRRWLAAWQARGIEGLADAALLGLLEHPTPRLRALVEEELQKKHHCFLGHGQAAPEAAGGDLPAGAAGSPKAPPPAHEARVVRASML